MLRLVFALLLLTPVAAAQSAPDTTAPDTVAPRRVTTADAHRPPVVQTVAASSLGALGGATLGGGLALLATRPGIFETPPELVWASFGGMALGAAGGAALDRRRSFWRALGGAALGQAAGIGVGLLAEQAGGGEVWYLAAPVGAVAGATLATR